MVVLPDQRFKLVGSCLCHALKQFPTQVAAAMQAKPSRLVHVQARYIFIAFQL